ncbi:sugar ABC transporter permease [Planococcus shenhongbingii]|uniref:Sugar ABC transporter permease n=1 Tax=Planococcus shenhongbingii TaxID=3058398 RepID=A0ABT8NHS2_9BACL|nr:MULTISPECIES: sugar ABC transporter permease [unclassified Planococcus (in: firmicutes)]MDN7246995.1 sugar ABC transporter permease [Planococcus sp. N017]WKA56897.1 sugar ABC transporter permease [Planococcus sp. N016]
MRISKTWSIILFLPFLICFTLFLIVPFVYGLYISFHQWSIFGGNGGFVGLDNYVSILTPGNVYSNAFYNGLKNTLIFVAISVVPLVVISLALALVVDSIPDKLKVFYRTVFFISYAVSVTAVSAIFKWLFTGNGGYVNNVMNTFGLGTPNWLNDQPLAWIAILIATVWWTIGFNMILFINALDEVDQNLYEAAGLDGANWWQRFSYITFPSIKGVFVFLTIITVIASFNLYGQTLLITAGGPAQSTTSLIMVIQQVVFNQNNLGMASAMSMLMGFVMVLIVAAQYFYTFRKD